MPDLIADGLKIHYLAAPPTPRPPAIVFLHGAGANHSVWLGQMKALRESAWVVLPDLPAHGRSGEIRGLTIEEYGRALVPFLETLCAAQTHGGPSRLTLAGHSMGGAIALSIALARPELLAGLVLIGSGARLGVSSEILQGLSASPKETMALVARMSFAPEADPALIMKTMRDLAGTSPGRTLADFRACNAFDVRGQIERITLPTLILCGREDRMTPPKYAAYLGDHMPHATVEIIEGAGHGVMIEAPEKVSGAIARFLLALPA